MLASRLRHVGLRDRRGAKGAIAKDTSQLGQLAQNGLPAGVMTRLGLEIALHAFHAAVETGAVLRLAEWRDPKVRSWPIRHSRHAPPALVVRECALKPFARRWRDCLGV